MANKVTDEERFNAAVRSYLDAGMAELRGWSRAKYVARSRELWEECQTDEKFPFKVLVDTRMPFLQSSESAYDYVDSRLRMNLEENRESNEGLYCESIGLMKPDGSLDTGESTSLHVPGNSPGSPVEATYLIALFDVLGFERMLTDLGIGPLSHLYKTMISTVLGRDRVEGFGLIRLGEGQYCASLMPVEISSAYFSDTLLLWVPLLQNHINPFLARCADIVYESLRLGVPLRGSIAIGDCIIHPLSSMFLGPPLVEAARLERIQEWIGVSFGLSALASGFRNELDHEIAVPFPTPCKPGKSELASGIVLDWPRRARARGDLDIDAIIDELAADASEAHALKYENTRKFLAYSKKLGGDKGTEVLHLRSIGVLAQEALTTRKGGSLPEDWNLQLELASSLGNEEAEVAEFLQSLASGDEVPKLPECIPSAFRDFLLQLCEAGMSDKEIVDLLEITQRVLFCRWEEKPITYYLRSELDKLRGTDSNLAAVADFLTCLAQPGCVPDVPVGLPTGHVQNLEFALAIVRGDQPPVDLNRLGEAILVAHSTGKEISPEMKQDLKLLSIAGDRYRFVSDYLAKLVSGEVRTLPTKLPEDLPESVRVFLRRIQAGTSQVFVPSATFPALFMVDYDVPFDLMSLAEEAVHYHRRGDTPDQAFTCRIRELAACGEPHDLVANELDSLAHRREIDLNLDGLPAVVRWYLMLVKAMSEERPAPMALELLGLAAVRSRISGKPIASYASYGFSVLRRGSHDAKIAASFLASVAEGSEIPQVPHEITGQWRTELLQIRAIAQYGHLFRAAVSSRSRSGRHPGTTAASRSS